MLTFSSGFAGDTNVATHVGQEPSEGQRFQKRCLKHAPPNAGQAPSTIVRAADSQLVSSFTLANVGSIFVGLGVAASSQQNGRRRGFRQLQRRSRVLRRARPSVSLNTIRVDLWDGTAMVLFLRTDAAGAVQLGRVGGYLDKVVTGGAIKKFVDTTGFNATAGSGQMLELSDRGLQRITIVGLGKQGDDEDWRLAGSTAASQLAKLKGGTAALVCIDGVQVQMLIEGVLAGLKGKGPENLELIGAYPAGSGEAIDKAQVAVGAT